MDMNYMPGTPSLIEDMDKKHLVLLRDGRTLVGYLRSVDQFGNLVLDQTLERIHVGQKYSNITRGIFVVRGENVALLGEIDLDRESTSPLRRVRIQEILEAQRLESEERGRLDKLKIQYFRDHGLALPHPDTLEEY